MNVTWVPRGGVMAAWLVWMVGDDADVAVQADVPPGGASVTVGGRF